MPFAIPVHPGESPDLPAIDTRADGGMKKTAGVAALAPLARELGDLQELLYAAGTHSLLLILQGMDTSGKDGTVRSVLRYVNPTGCRVVGFKVPSVVERAHDFLWRVHRETPERGAMVVFNRSHYEDVLVTRVNGLIEEPTWRARYGHINAFERLLVDAGTIVVKIFLHISEVEQEERLRAREADPTKAWKLSAGDWVERRRWDDYQTAYGEALAACSMSHAPWWIVPADRKWFRNLAVAEAVVSALRPHRPTWEAELDRRGASELAEISALRDGTTGI
ncbi:MAG: Polyphosphate kinase 2 [uncultured Thermomicrobiales bacterium]|uniref:Polyphosphate kinase 2 n=1 Tax=uncultured Thermomicrobiales bacterium TaxID=1645740 RepID=A0A6J4UW17_9BACT|nr:MAG: Polyphosphate kinase 2 [uncultured Thermomicrobiales bacterium]